MTIAVIDYGMGNLHSVAKALEHVTHENVVITRDPRCIRGATRLVLPGQGAIRDCMGELERTELRGLVDELLAAQSKPLLGICVGVATLIYVPRLGSASPTTGLLWELEAIAAVIVGGTALRGGAGSVAGTVVGAILLSVISNILNLTSIISVYLNAAVQGFVIIIVAFMQRRRP